MTVMNPGGDNEQEDDTTRFCNGGAEGQRTLMEGGFFYLEARNMRRRASCGMWGRRNILRPNVASASALRRGQFCLTQRVGRRPLWLECSAGVKEEEVRGRDRVQM